MSDRPRCERPTGMLHRFCAGMQLALQGTTPNGEGKGLHIASGWLGDEERARILGIHYRPKARAEAIVLNFCPWCGERIRFDEETS